MNDPNQEPNDSFSAAPLKQKSFPWGCLLGGCLSVVLLMVVGVGATAYLGFVFYKSQVEKYTSTTPAEIPVVEFSEEQIAEVNKRVEGFKQSIKPGGTPEELTLTADDINALISKEEKLKGHVYVSIQDGELTGEISYPTDSFLGTKGRYFNGEVSLKASLENGVLIVTLDDAKVNGESLPETFIAEMRKQNLAKDVYKNPENAELLRKFESLVIEDDKIILKPRIQPSVAESTDAPATAPSSEPAQVEDATPQEVDPKE